MNKIDINCDLGEGVGNEAKLMPYISSCNIACGAHAGSVDIIDDVITLAHKHNVKIGAHPSYPDRENFGRKKIDMPLDELQLTLIDQINLLKQHCEALTNKPINHIKAHGALYNSSAVEEDIAKTVVKAILQTAPHAKLFVPPHSVIEKEALKSNINICYEVFADRNYRDDLTLVPRSEHHAVITNKKDVVDHILNMVLNQHVKTVSGKNMQIKADTCCVHGDNQQAVEIVEFLHQELTAKGITIA